MRPRDCVEPIIGHLKSDDKMKRYFLTEVLGDALNVLLSASGQNLRKSLRWLYFCAGKVPPVVAVYAHSLAESIKK
ncbi:hypothetical protein A8C75_06830 [Marinobacterium aestuarii]|uniref:Uncharacterized protein n=1 Tax=Marinobacterium aestuarii TaxID=1821621 RepID=A0A1A9EWP5_9GAMM|nr:hypothetical protein A8C75_06830 [Marinobacterium aestuarii]